jgi:hypothetical protein
VVATFTVPITKVGRPHVSSSGLLPSIVVLGTDAVLAVRPATAIQLAHACRQAGFDLAVPASWGDELISADVLRESAAWGAGPAILCTCPHVRARLISVGNDLEPFMISRVAPPVATARFLRALYTPREIRLTYVGTCPAAADEVFDERFTPDAFLTRLADERVDIRRQPEVFDSVLPPDRRRHYSLAGGLPAAELLWSDGGGRAVVELDAEDLAIQLAQALLSRERVLVDLAVRLRCACSGAVDSMSPRDARRLVLDAEPPRAASEIVTAPPDLDLHVSNGDLASAVGGISADGAWSERDLPQPPLGALVTHAAPATPVRPLEERISATATGETETRRSDALLRAHLRRPRSRTPQPRWNRVADGQREPVRHETATDAATGAVADPVADPLADPVADPLADTAVRAGVVLDPDGVAPCSNPELPEAPGTSAAQAESAVASHTESPVQVLGAVAASHTDAAVVNAHVQPRLQVEIRDTPMELIAGAARAVFAATEAELVTSTGELTPATMSVTPARETDVDRASDVDAAIAYLRTTSAARGDERLSELPSQAPRRSRVRQTLRIVLSIVLAVLLLLLAGSLAQ